MKLASAIYTGHVLHVRHRPRQHKLRYGVFSLLLDLDELPALDRSPLALRAQPPCRLCAFTTATTGDGDGRWAGEPGP